MQLKLKINSWRNEILEVDAAENLDLMKFHSASGTSISSKPPLRNVCFFTQAGVRAYFRFEDDDVHDVGRSRRGAR